MAQRLLLIVTWAAYCTFIVGSYVEILVGWSQAMEWVHNYQTLIGGILAILGAAIGAWFLSRQTAQVDRHERERLQRRRDSVRTALPLALSAITRYSVDAAGATKTLLDQCVEDNFPDRDQLTLPENPAIPSDAITIVRDMVECVPSDEARPFATLIADLQVQASRLSETIAIAGDKEKLLARYNMEEYIIDCALIYARAGSLFVYARGATDTVPQNISWADVQAALYFFGMLDDDYDRVRATMLRRSGNDLANVVTPRWSARTF